MLFRDYASLYEHLRDFFICEQEGAVVGCCALEVVWHDLAEIKSLAVADQHRGSGVGRRLVAAAIDEARSLGIGKVFALTLEEEFFQKLGFKPISKDALPQKVWSDCLACPTRDDCRELAVLIELTDASRSSGSN